MIEFIIKLRVNPKKEIMKEKDMNIYQVVDKVEDGISEMLEDAIDFEVFEDVDWKITNRIYE